ncbi:type I secretion system permease/ATPase [Pseudovibrio sp. Tun.PSC04-5.I4]|uniref:type I secretion system permease/ATPase n=1 Tax=Pseudovibrio sp. Tun.PSC04-5.I4 TaxID=1798213 RepID=UPI00088159BD|nr:ATP-binding cassette, subfamily C [Pseudovibrio sp. Tun.PSC04-5.I4]
MAKRSQEHTPYISNAFRRLYSAFWGIGGISMLINLLMLTGPLFMLQVYDRVLSSSSVPTLVVLSVFVAVLYVFLGLLEGLRNRVLLRIGQRVDEQLSGLAFEASTRIPVTLGAEGERTRPVTDLDTIRQFLSGSGPSAIFDMPWMPLYLAIIFMFHPLLGFTAMGGALAICILMALNELSSRRPALETAIESGRRTSLVEICRRNSESIEAMGMIDTLRERWEDGNDTYLGKQRKASDRSNIFTTMIKTLRFMLQSGILGLGAWLVIQQEASAGVMIASSIMTARALAPVEQAIANWRGFAAARIGMARLNEVFKTHAPAEERVELPFPEKSLVVERLFCGPIASSDPFVKDISLELKAGDGLGIVGHSGSGKSTLTRAMVGITPSLKGSVRFDGAELDQWSMADRGDFIGYLPQDIQLFDGTIAENIQRFKDEKETDKLIAAARMANVHDLIVSLPDGYNTVIGASGNGLSGGQRQRIALARALYGNPFLIVLDEPNSNLDAEGEAALTNAIHQMREAGSIVIVVAHRPAATSAVDQILHMREGQLRDFGPKDRIMKQVIAPLHKKPQEVA